MRSPILYTLAGLLTTSSLVAEEGITRHYFEDSREVASLTVQRGGLIHTRLLETSPDQSLKGSFADFTTQLDDIAEKYETSLARVAKLNLYLGSENTDDITAVKTLIAAKWGRGKAPSLTLIPSHLPNGSLLAGDAVILADASEKNTALSDANAAMMPADRDIIYVSGRAASGELAPATADTMQQLFAVLAHLNTKPEDVVQVKAFLQPIQDWETVKAEIDKSFGGNAPPTVFVEWTSTSRSTEIELIAAAPEHQSDRGPISYFTPPGDKKSPVYSRVARVHSDSVIYLSELASPGGVSDTRELLQGLADHAASAGSDQRHFAKATYYVTTAEASSSLNTVRPDYYDPERPPAASKVMIRSIGDANLQSLIDMIAVPTGK